jgi:acyl-CoA reductase-like NAD-dependent aldehyde dehydrogenase
LKTEFEQMVPGATTDDGRLEVTAPFDGRIIGSVQAADAAAVERALIVFSRTLPPS